MKNPSCTCVAHGHIRVDVQDDEPVAAYRYGEQNGVGVAAAVVVTMHRSMGGGTLQRQLNAHDSRVDVTRKHACRRYAAAINCSCV
jgi:hypothetical protein